MDVWELIERHSLFGIDLGQLGSLNGFVGCDAEDAGQTVYTQTTEHLRAVVQFNCDEKDHPALSLVTVYTSL